jgi:uncharacterized protein (DUF1800 family)
MRSILKFLPPCLTVVFLVLGWMGLRAQSVVVTPSFARVAPGETIQRTATVSGLGEANVTWTVRGANPQNGTISPTGLYTAPKTLPKNDITITALASDKKTLGTVYANVVALGPAIKSVSPAPIPFGRYSATLSGTGFQPGATVTLGGVPQATAYVSETMLRSAGYQRAGPSEFKVLNPGTLPGPAFAADFVDKTQPAHSPLVVSPIVVANRGPDSTPSASAVADTAETPVVRAVGDGRLPLGFYNVVINGAGLSSGSVVRLNGTPITTTYDNGSLIASVFDKDPGPASITVSNGSKSSAAFKVEVGVEKPLASPAASRRLLEQAAFGPTPEEATHVQEIGIRGWIEEQFNSPQTSSYADITSSQGGMPTRFLTNAVNSPDQLRQRVAFSLSQIFVTSFEKIIWNANMVSFQDMLLADSFTNYRKIMEDVTLSPAMGFYLDMANNAKADKSKGSLANENYARELMQLFTLGTNLLNQDGTLKLDDKGLPIPTYSQFQVTEFARVYTGWTFAPSPGKPVFWGAFMAPGKMVPYPPEHDSGSKHLLNGYVAPAGVSPQQDVANALDNIFNHPNLGPFLATLLIQHLVKSDPSPAYVSRVAAAFNDNGTHVRGDMNATIMAVLLDPEARAGDEGGRPAPGDGHLQEPALFIAGIVRAFGGTMNEQNYYTQELAAMEQNIFNAPSVFNYYAPDYRVPGKPLMGGEFQIYSPNNAVARANEVADLFNQYSNPIQTLGPGTSVNLSPFTPLGSDPPRLIDALDLTLTHGVMPAEMKSKLIDAVTIDSRGNLHRVQTACYLILTSGFYNVWH